MAIAAAWAGMYLFLSNQSWRSRAFAVCTAASGIVCALVSMSRGALLGCLMIICGSAVCYGRGKEVIYVGVILFLGAWMIGGESQDDNKEIGMYGATMKRFADKRDTVGSRADYLIKDLEIGLTDYPFGTGLGIGQPFGSVGSLSIRALENEHGRILMEVGIPGLIGIFLMRLMIVVVIGSYLFSCTDKTLLAFYAPSTAMIAVSFLFNIAFNHTNSSMTWCVVALIFGAFGLQDDAQKTSKAGLDPRPMTN